MATTTNNPGANGAAPPLPPESDKPAAPAAVPPQLTLGDDPQPQRTVPAIDITATYAFAQNVYSNIGTFKLLTKPLDTNTRRRISISQTKEDADLENMLENVLTAFGPALFSTPPDLAGRQQRRAELAALDVANTNIGILAQLFSDTVLVRRDQFIRETISWAGGIVNAAQVENPSGAPQNPASLAAAAAIQQLKDKASAADASHRQSVARNTGDQVDAARTDLQNIINSLEAENQYLRTRAIGLDPGAPPSSVPAPTTTPAKGHTSHTKGTTATATPPASAPPAVATSASDRRTPKR